MHEKVRRDASVERLAPRRYVFHATWALAAPRQRVFCVLADLERYPDWWPAFKRAHLVDSNHCDLAVRTLLPITLRFTLQRNVEDPAAGLLRATATGDIVGLVEWQVTTANNRDTLAQFKEDVTLEHSLASRLDRAIRPLLEWNHRLAMNSGAAGLTRHLRRPD